MMPVVSQRQLVRPLVQQHLLSMHDTCHPLSKFDEESSVEELNSSPARKQKRSSDLPLPSNKKLAEMSAVVLADHEKSVLPSGLAIDRFSLARARVSNVHFQIRTRHSHRFLPPFLAAPPPPTTDPKCRAYGCCKQKNGRVIREVPRQGGQRFG